MEGTCMWHPYDGGKTADTLGSENGIILLDEKYSLGASIALKENGYQPWAITYGIYGNMIYTTIASAKAKAHEKHEAMKSKLAAFLDYIYSDSVSTDQALERMDEWCNDFVDNS